MNSKEMVKLAYNAFSDKKGEDIKTIDIQSVSILVDYFIIAYGNSPNQVQAMIDNVEEVLGREGCECKQIEGYQDVNRILMDHRDMIAHMFCKGDRLFYDLERIWRDGKIFVDMDEL